MPANEEEKQSIQKDLLQELHDLQAVLDAETADAIPVLSDVVTVSSAADTVIPSDAQNANDAASGDESNNDNSAVPMLSDGIPTSDSDADTSQSSTEPAANDSASEPPLITEEKAKPAPFALVENSADEYDSSAAESLIEDGLNDALKSSTAQMDDEALRLVDELVAEHAELIRQQLKLKLAAKSKELQAESDIIPP